MTGPGVRTARSGAWFLFLFLWAGSAAGQQQTAGGQPGAAGEPDVLLRAMQDELARSTGTLQLEELERPYFIEYAVVDTESTVLEATFGANVRDNQSRTRSLRVDVRVGSHELDNSEFMGMRSMFSRRNLPRTLVREDDYGALRHDLWLATDGAYKEALEQLAQKRAFIQNRVQDEPVPDFSDEEAFVLIEPPAESAFDGGAWRETVRMLSEVFREYPEIDESSVTLRVEASNKHLVNSDGSMVRQPASLAVLYARAATRAPDGMRLKHFVPFYARSAEDLPAEAELEAAVRSMAGELTALAAAPVLDDYIGPVLVAGQASAELFTQVLGAQLSGHRPPLFEDERMGAMMMRSSGLANRLNRRVLPAGFDVVDDPTREAFAGEPLIGSYAVDDQGVQAQAVTLVEGGVLRTLLMSRRPRTEIPQSNGHARATAFGSPTAQVGNLFVRAEDGLGAEELKQELIALAEDAGLDYGVLIRMVDDPGISGTEPLSTSSIILMTQGGPNQSQLTRPILAYKVHVEDGREELVRGLGFRDVSVRSLRDIVASGEDQYVNNRFLVSGGGGFPGGIGVLILSGFGGPGGLGVPVAVVAPSVLFEELEIERAGGAQQTPALLEHPYFGQERQ